MNDISLRVIKKIKCHNLTFVKLGFSLLNVIISCYKIRKTVLIAVKLINSILIPQQLIITEIHS